MPKRSVLYMEDDAGLARLAQRRLRRAGYDVTIAHDGDEGLRLYSNGSYDLVAIDHNMPGKDGLQIIQILSSTETPPPMIMITGSGNERLAVEALKLGVGDYVVKDVDGGYLDLLPAVMAHVLESASLAEDKRQAEQALTVSEARYRTLFESMPIGLYSMDMQGVILSANKALASILHVEQQELIGSHMSQFMADETARVAWQKTLKDSELSHSVELCLRKADGAVAWIRATAATVSENGKNVHIEGSIEDITRQRAASKQVERQSALLDAINQVFRGSILDDDEESIATTFVQLALRITHSDIACIQLDSGVSLAAYADSQVVRGSRLKFYSELEEQAETLDCGALLSSISTLEHPIALNIPNQHNPVTVSCLMSLQLQQDGAGLGRMTLARNSEPYSEQGRSDAETLTTAFVEAIIRNRAEEERRQLISELQSALDQVQTLGGLLPICASCKKIRTDAGYWQEVELYLGEHSEAEFTHGLCPDCAARYMAELDELEQERSLDRKPLAHKET